MRLFPQGRGKLDSHRLIQEWNTRMSSVLLYDFWELKIAYRTAWTTLLSCPLMGLEGYWMRVSRAQGKIGEGNNPQLAKNKIYDAFAAILGRGKAKSKESMQARKSQSSFTFDIQAINRRQNQKQEQQEMFFSDNIQIQIPLQYLPKQKVKNPKKIRQQSKFPQQRQIKLAQKPQKTEITCKKSGKCKGKQSWPLNFADQQQNLWFQDEENIQQVFIPSPFDEEESINNKVLAEKQLKQCKFVIELQQDIDELRVAQKGGKNIRNVAVRGKKELPEGEITDKIEIKGNNPKGKKAKLAKPVLREVEFIVFIQFNKLEQQLPPKNPTCKKSGKGPTPPSKPLQYQPQIDVVQICEAPPKQFSPFQLGRASLQQLVKQLQKRKLISCKLAQQFHQNSNDSNIRTYIQKFNQGRLHQFNFMLLKITILDHRRIAELLLSLFPGQYDIRSVCNPDKTILEFLEKEYLLSGQEYFYLYDQIDKISKIKWWSKILIANEDKMVRINKEKRLAERRAKRAEKAVEEVLRQCRQRSLHDVVDIDDLDHQEEQSDKGPSKMVKPNE